MNISNHSMLILIGVHLSVDSSMASLNVYMHKDMIACVGVT